MNPPRPRAPIPMTTGRPQAAPRAPMQHAPQQPQQHMQPQQPRGPIQPGGHPPQGHPQGVMRHAAGHHPGTQMGGGQPPMQPARGPIQPQGHAPQGQPMGRGPIQPHGGHAPQHAPQGQPMGQPQGGGIRAVGTQPQGRVALPPTAQAAPPAPRQQGGIVGTQAARAAYERQLVENERLAQERQSSYKPSRFYLPSPEKRGVQRQDLEANIVILDQQPTFSAYEHKFDNPPGPRRPGQRGFGFECLCIAETGHCPACDSDPKTPYFAMFLSVIDMRGYTNRNGVYTPHSRKLLAVKTNNQDYFWRQLDRRGTLRGMQLLMVRRAKTEAAHGTPDFIDIHPEEAIIEAFQHPQVLDRTGQRVVKEANADCYAYDYTEIFPRPDYQWMLDTFGGQAAAGSFADQYQTFGQDAGQMQGVQARVNPGRGRIGIATSGGGGMQGHGNEDSGYDQHYSGQYGGDPAYEDAVHGSGDDGGQYDDAGQHYQSPDDAPFPGDEGFPEQTGTDHHSGGPVDDIPM